MLVSRILIPFGIGMLAGDVGQRALQVAFERLTNQALRITGAQRVMIDAAVGFAGVGMVTAFTHFARR